MNTFLLRGGGLAAALAGLLFIAVQTLHPPEVLAAVTTPRWAAVHALTLVMALLGLPGVTAISVRQASRTGWLGLAGFLLLGAWFVLVTAFTFVEAFVLPLLTVSAPAFVEGVLGLFSGRPGGMDLGALGAAGPLSGLLYTLGGLALGLSSWRAGVLPRGAGALMVVAALSPLAALLPHDMQRVAAVPMGLSLIWFGVALWSDARARGGAEPATLQPG